MGHVPPPPPPSDPPGWWANPSLGYVPGPSPLDSVDIARAFEQQLEVERHRYQAQVAHLASSGNYAPDVTTTETRVSAELTLWPWWLWWTLFWIATDVGALVYTLSRLADRR